MRPYGLVLSGGQSTRMGRDKGSIVYPPRALDQRSHLYQLLKPHCEKVFVSVNSGQVGVVPGDFPLIADCEFGQGPGLGLLSAERLHPNQSWLVVACDFPWLEKITLDQLIRDRDPLLSATAFEGPGGFVEPFLTIWEPRAVGRLRHDFSTLQFSPRKTLEALNIARLKPEHLRSLQNVNLPNDLSHQNS